MNEEMKKEIVPFSDALVKFSVAQHAIQDLEESTKIEITDAESEKIIRKHRQNAKALEVKIGKTRLRLNREYKEKTSRYESLILPRVTAAYDLLDKKIKLVEAAREKAKEEKVKAENDRISAIKARFDILALAASKPLEYNRPAVDIETDIVNLESFEINETDFQERKIEADSIKAGAIINAKSALAGRMSFEAGQAESARIKAEQEEEAARIKEEKAAIEKEAAEAAKIRENEARALKAEREQFEADKAEVERQIIISKRDLAWDAAHHDNFNMDHELALRDHSVFKTELLKEMDQAREDATARWNKTEEAKAAAEARMKLIGPDKLILHAIADGLDEVISGFDIPTLSTDDANELVRDLISSIKSRINVFDTDAKELK